MPCFLLFLKNLQKTLDILDIYELICYNIIKIKREANSKKLEREKVMKAYANGMKSSTVSRKQVGVLYGMAKRGEVKIEKFVMADFYDISDYYGYDDNRTLENDESSLKEMINLAFEKKYDELQEAVDKYSEKLFHSFSKKRQQESDRSLVA